METQDKTNEQSSTTLIEVATDIFQCQPDFDANMLHDEARDDAVIDEE